MTETAPVRALVRPSSVASLSPYEAACLLALRRSRNDWLVVTPSERFTGQVLRHLADRGLVELPGPDGSWDATQHGDTTPHEMLGWRHAWPAYNDSAELDEALEDRLTETPWYWDLPESRIELWCDVAYAEVFSYAERQLSEHQFDPAWARDLDWVRKGVGRLPIAKWRYVVWAAVRRGATEFLRNRGNQESTRKAIHGEYLKRAEMVRTGAAGLGQFAPSNSKPWSLLAQVLVTCVLPIEKDYWVTEPNTWAANTSRPLE